jgi:hypothetical protein
MPSDVLNLDDFRSYRPAKDAPLLIEIEPIVD